MGLAIRPDEPVGADQHGRVVEHVRLALEQPAHDVGVEASTRLREHLRRRAGDLLGERQRLLGALEHVAGHRTLGEHQQLGTGRDRLREPRETDLEVALLLPELGVQLGHGDPHAASLIV